MIEMNRTVFLITFFILISSSLTGCISNDSESDNIELTVQFAKTNGTIIKSFADGELVSTENVILNFNFDKTTSSSDLTIFGIETNGEQYVTESEKNSEISIEFSSHGFYHLNAYAIDENENSKNMSIFVRIDSTVHWIESNTNNPEPVKIEPVPENNGKYPEMIEVFSKVENPSIISDFGGGGQSVQFTWQIVDRIEDVCQKKSSEVEDGESDEWETIHFNTYEDHELIITYDDGQDNINVEHYVTIMYAEEETLPNM